MSCRVHLLFFFCGVEKYNNTNNPTSNHSPNFSKGSKDILDLKGPRHISQNFAHQYYCGTMVPKYQHLISNS